MSKANQTRSVVRAVFDAFQAHDLERFRALLSDDAVLREPSTEAVHRGSDAVVAAIKATLDAFPDLRPKVKNLFADGEQAVAEVVRRGTHTGELNLPSGSVSSTGRDVRLPECILFRVRDGTVVSMTAYVDRLHVLEELGRVPHTEEAPHSEEVR